MLERLWPRRRARGVEPGVPRRRHRASGTACIPTGSSSGRARKPSPGTSPTFTGRSATRRSILTDVASAELIKYASNAYLATRLTFVNSIAEICEAAGADIRSVMAGMGSDHRIGTAFLQPGPGGAARASRRTPRHSSDTAGRLGCDLALVQAAIAVNAQHKQRVVDKVTSVLDGHVSGQTHRAVGADLQGGDRRPRGSPRRWRSRRRLVELGAAVHAYDPTVPAGTLQGIEVHSSSFSACKDADALVIGTEWPEFAVGRSHRFGGGHEWPGHHGCPQPARSRCRRSREDSLIRALASPITGPARAEVAV